MPFRKLNKKERIRVVTWIRQGADPVQGAMIYSSLPANEPRLVKAFIASPAKYAGNINEQMSQMLGITLEKFNQILSKHAGKHIEKTVSNRRSNPIKRASAIAEEKPGRTFRAQYPFLSREDCPKELKILAADKITAWERYTAAHEKLFDCSTLDDCYETARTLINNFKENRLIEEEFKHYQDHGAPLGKHFIWNQSKQFEQFRGMSIIDLVRMYEKTIPHRIWRIQSEINKGDKPHLNFERGQRIREAEAELAEVKRLLGVK